MVARADDVETRAVLETGAERILPLRRVSVHQPGVVAAMAAGLAAASGEIVAITDDDAAPKPDWLENVVGAMKSSDRVAGAGGRDLVHDENGVVAGKELNRRVGQLQWFGRAIGNHHLGAGMAREVDFLKGVNCAYRTNLLRDRGFDSRLRGGGAQVHWELSLGLALRRAGWKLVYDPAILVDHYPAPRFDADGRNTFNARAASDASYNETLVLQEHLPAPRRAAYYAWSEAIGSRASPGALQFLRLRLGGDAQAGAKWRAAAGGRRDARAVFRGLGGSATQAPVAAAAP